MITTCSRCSDPATGTCTGCGRPYCPRHGGGGSTWDDSGCCNQCIDHGSGNYTLGVVFAVITALIVLAMALSL
jgi:hypothetical protein